MSKFDLIVVDCPIIMDDLDRLTCADLWIVPINGSLALDNAVTLVAEVRSEYKACELEQPYIVAVPNNANFRSVYGKKLLKDMADASADQVWEPIPSVATVEHAELRKTCVWDTPHGEGGKAHLAFSALADEIIRLANKKREKAFMVVFKNFKGGCGKSTLSVHTANHAAAQGLSVMLVDTDEQGDAFIWSSDGEFGPADVKEAEYYHKFDGRLTVFYSPAVTGASLNKLKG